MNDQDQMTFMLFGAALLILLLACLVVIAIAYKRRQHNHTLKNIELKHELDNQLLQSRIETQDRSFQYFSEEIHDNIGQVLSVVGMQLYQLQSEYAGERAAKLLQESSELLNKAINDLRSISHTLHDRYLNRAGLAEALRTEIEYINAVKPVLAKLEVIGEPVELSSDRQTLLFRIIQEAVSNALKHAKASLITIELNYDNKKLGIIIRDNGIGFDPVQRSKARVGLTNMELRTRLLGGQMHVDSGTGTGTSILLNVDVQ